MYISFNIYVDICNYMSARRELSLATLTKDSYSYTRVE